MEADWAMNTALVLGGMLCCAFVVFIILARLVRAGVNGWAVTILSLIGAGLAVALYASGRPFGIDPVLAMSAAMLGFVPALIGGGAGALLGWLLRMKDDQRAS